MSASTETVQERIEQCQGLVRSLAMGVHRKMPPHVELDDLISYGQVGLAEAARDFDPAHGSQFSTYAYYRIRGAVYDGLSKMSWHSRTQYKKIRSEQMANEVLQADAAQTDASAEQSAESEMRWFRNLSQTLAVVYLVTQGDEQEGPKDAALADTSAPLPPAAAISHEINQKLREIIDALPEDAGTLIKATYFEGLTLQEAGKKLGISKSWASRLHAKTLQRLAHSLRLLGVASSD